MILGVNKKSGTIFNAFLGSYGGVILGLLADPAYCAPPRFKKMIKNVLLAWKNLVTRVSLSQLARKTVYDEEN